MMILYHEHDEDPEMRPECGFRAMANIIPTRWRTSFRGHGERHSDMMANMIPK
jgi:hypothetical protein